MFLRSARGDTVLKKENTVNDEDKHSSDEGKQYWKM